jgi:hypothetical protein
MYISCKLVRCERHQLISARNLNFYTQKTIPMVDKKKLSIKEKFALKNHAFQ